MSDAKAKKFSKFKAITVFFLIFLTLMTASFGALTANAAATLSLGSSTLYPKASATTSTVSVSSSYKGWTVTDNVSWMSVSKTGYYSFVVSVQANTSASSRTGTITVNANGTKKYVSVKQSANSMTVTTSSNSFAPGGGTNTITAKPLTGSTSASTGSSWLTVTKSGNTYTVKAAQNLTGSSRSGTVTVKCGSITKSVTFKQSAYTLTLGSTSVSAKVGGSTHDMSLSSSYSGWTVSDNASWISVSRTGTSSYKIVAAANTNSSSRTGTVTVTSAGVKKTVTVSQPANSMTVTTSSNSFAPGGGTNTITAKPLTGSTSASTGSSWLTVTKSGNTYTVKAAANTTGKVRSGVVAITCGNITKSVTFTQNPYTLTLGSSSASAAAAGSNHTISVSSNYSGWTVSDNASWMSVSKTGSYSFIISVTPNINGTSRSGIVTVQAPGVKKTFTVNQAANSMTVTASSTSFAPGGGTNTITAKPLTGSTSYSTSAAWLTVTKSGNTYTVKAASNTTGKARSGNVTITCGNITKTVTFKQTAHVIKVDLNSISRSGNASTATLNVTSTYDAWTLSDNSSWMSAARTGTCTFLISIGKNTTTSARTGTVTISGGGVSCTVTVNQERIPLTIKLDANGGSVSTTSFTRYYGDKLGTIPAPKVPDERYVFAGWYTAVEGGTRVSADTVVKDNMTLYARWKYSVLELNAAASEIYYGQGEKYLTTEYGSIVNRSYTYSFSANGTGASLSPNVVGWAVPNDYTIAVYCSENWTVRGSTPWIKVYNADTKTEVTGGSAGYYELFIVVGDNFTQNPGSWKLVGSERNGSVVIKSNSGKTRSVAIKQYGPGETRLRNNGGQRSACLNRALVDPSSYDKYITELEFFTLGTKLHHIDNNTYVVTRCQATGCGLSGDYYPTMTLSTDYIIFEVEHDATAARIKVVYASDYSANSLSIDDITCKYTAKSSPFSMEPIIKAEVNNKVGEAAYKLGDFLVGTAIDLSEKIPVVGKPINITAKVFVGAVEVFDGANASMSDGYTIEEEMSTDVITQTSSVVYVESATITASGIKLAEKGDQLRIENNFIGTDDVSIKVTVKIGGYSFTF